MLSETFLRFEVNDHQYENWELYSVLGIGKLIKLFTRGRYLYTIMARVDVPKLYSRHNILTRNLRITKLIINNSREGLFYAPRAKHDF